MLRWSAVWLLAALGLGFGVQLLVYFHNFSGPSEDRSTLVDSESSDFASLLQVTRTLSPAETRPSEIEHHTAADPCRLTSRIHSGVEVAAQFGAVSRKGREVGVVASSGPFAIIALPDTQYYSGNPGTEHPYEFIAQTEWIKDQVATKGNPKNIKFVTQLGDVVDDDKERQWIRANTSISVLASKGGPYVVPLSMVPGNHDYLISSDKTWGAPHWVKFFGPERFSGANWYGGADPSGQNSFTFFSGGGFDFLHIGLEWQADHNLPVRKPSPLEWASEVLQAYPSIPVIVSTHDYLKDDKDERTYSGEQVFKELLTKHDQVFMVLCAHYHMLNASENGGQRHRVVTNDFGHPVIEVLQDFQEYPNGGNGWLRIITFDPAAGQLHFETYSPVLDRYNRLSVEEMGPRASDFMIPLDFTARLSQRTDPL